MRICTSTVAELARHRRMPSGHTHYLTPMPMWALQCPHHILVEPKKGGRWGSER